MKTFIALMFLSFSALAFHPKDIADANVLEVSPCFGRYCLVLEKDGVNYLAVGEVRGDDFIPVDIFIFEEGKLRRIWNILWKET